jgi:HNH endonuclease
MKALGRPLLKTETVHHIDGDHANADISNLQLRQGNHGTGVVLACRTCGSHDVVAVPIADPAT